MGSAAAASPERSGRGKTRLAPPAPVLSPPGASVWLSPGSRLPRWKCSRPSPARAAVNLPAPLPRRPPELGRGRGAQGARVGPAATRGPRAQLDLPPPARPRGLNAVNPSIKPRRPPRSPSAARGACFVSRPPPGPGPGEPGRAGPLRGLGSAARSHEAPRALPPRMGTSEAGGSPGLALAGDRSLASPRGERRRDPDPAIQQGQRDPGWRDWPGATRAPSRSHTLSGPQFLLF